MLAGSKERAGNKAQTGSKKVAQGQASARTVQGTVRAEGERLGKAD